MDGQRLKDPALELSIDDLIRLKVSVAELIMFKIDVDYLIAHLGFTAGDFKYLPGITLDDWSLCLGLRAEHLNGPLQMVREEYSQLANSCRWDLGRLAPD